MCIRVIEELMSFTFLVKKDLLCFSLLPSHLNGIIKKQTKCYAVMIITKNIVEDVLS